MQRSQRESVDVLIVLMSLVAEGTPQLALQLARQWQSDGLRVEVMVMQPEPLDLQAEFQDLDVPLHWIDLGCGLARYWALLCHSYRLSRRLRARSVMSFPFGLAVPFVLSGYLIQKFLIFSKNFKKNINLVSKSGGIILLITGILILTNQLQALGYYLLNVLPFLQNFG